MSRDRGTNTNKTVKRDGQTEISQTNILEQHMAIHFIKSVASSVPFLSNLIIDCDYSKKNQYTNIFSYRKYYKY